MSRKASLHQARTAQLLRVQSLLFGVPLASTHTRIEQVIQALSDRVYGPRADVAIDLEDGGGLPLPDQVEVYGGVAVVPIRGTFAPRAGLYDAMSGMVSYEDIAALVQAVDQRADVRGHVLAFDTPGGAVAGVTEAAQAIAQLEKDAFAVADGQAASAGYWLAAQGKRLYLPLTGMVGSIGVYAVRLDQTTSDQQKGFAYTFVSSGDRKADSDPHKAVTTAELADLQRIVGDSAALFFASVAKARKLDVAAIAAMDGAVFQGTGTDNAVTRGLADAIGTVADAVLGMQAHLTRKARATSRPTITHAATAPQPKGEATMSTETTQEATAPSNVVSIDEKKIREEATAQATTAMQSRTDDIVGLCALAKCSERAMAFVQDAKLTAADVRKILTDEAVTADAETTVTSHTAARRPSSGDGPTIDTSAIYARRGQSYQQARDRRAEQARQAFGH